MNLNETDCEKSVFTLDTQDCLIKRSLMALQDDSGGFSKIISEDKI